MRSFIQVSRTIVISYFSLFSFLCADPVRFGYNTNKSIPNRTNFKPFKDLNIVKPQIVIAVAIFV